MLVLREQIIGKTVASVQSGLPCGTVYGFVINPNSLAIELLTIKDLRGTYYLLPGDIRHITAQRVIVDAEEKLSEADDLLRHQNLIKQGFDPVGKTIVTESKKKLGKVTNYAIDDTSWRAAKLYAAPGIIGSTLGKEHIIDSADIVQVEPKKIIVRDLRNTNKKPLTIPLPKNIA